MKYEQPRTPSWFITTWTVGVFTIGFIFGYLVG